MHSLLEKKEIKLQQVAFIKLRRKCHLWRLQDVDFYELALYESQDNPFDRFTGKYVPQGEVVVRYGQGDGTKSRGTIQTLAKSVGSLKRATRFYKEQLKSKLSEHKYKTESWEVVDSDFEMVLEKIIFNHELVDDELSKVLEERGWLKKQK